MIQKPNRYDDVQAGYSERLPIGGYVLKILDTRIENYSWGDVLILRFDIAEGDHAGFFQMNFNDQLENRKWKGTYRINLPKNDGTEQDDWAIKKLKSAVTAIEKSNDGYSWNWDERTLKGKLVGGLFGNKEWEMNGNRGWYTDCRTLCSVERIRSGNFQVPADKHLNSNNGGSSHSPNVNDAFSVVDDDIPF